MYPIEIRAALGQEGLASVHKYGYSAAVTTTQHPVWDKGGNYSYPSSATEMTVSSGDATDTEAGVGARTVEVLGLDANYDMVSEIVTLDGQTGVVIPTDLIRVFRVAVLTDGSSGEDANAGIIYVGEGTVTAGVPAIIYAQVSAGEGQTLMAMYTVPRGFTGLLYSWRSSTGRLSDATADLYKRPFGGVFRIQDRSPTFEGPSSNEELVPIKIAAKTDLEGRAKAAAGTIEVGYRFTLMLIPNVD